MLELIEKKQVELAPGFTGLDAKGRYIKLSDYTGRSNVVLVLNRGFQ
jgi:hypothetical protein